MTVTINTHYSSREEVEELKEYLEKKCWDFSAGYSRPKEVSAEPEAVSVEDPHITMDLHTEPGTEIKYTGRGGYEFDRSHAGTTSCRRVRVHPRVHA